MVVCLRKVEIISLSSVYIVILFSVCWENVLLEAFRPFPAATRALTKATVQYSISTNDNPLLAVSCIFTVHHSRPQLSIAPSFHVRAFILWRNPSASRPFYEQIFTGHDGTQRIQHQNTICSCWCLYQEQSLQRAQ